jgi:hypothetical protein
MNRLFTLGCSFTRYHWPTWANILARSFDLLENWGISGIGNRAIFERLIEVNQSKKLTKDDIVIIQWTDPNRFDLHDKQTSWVGTGSLLNSNSNLPSIVRHGFWNEKSYLMHSCNFVLAAMHVLDRVGCKYYFISMNDFISDVDRFEELEFYQPDLKRLFRFEPIKDWFDRSDLPKRKFSEPKKLFARGSSVKSGINFIKVEDQHPTPWAHYLYLDRVLRPEIDLDIDEYWAKEAESVLDDVVSYLQMQSAYQDKLKWDNIKSCVKGL